MDLKKRIDQSQLGKGTPVKPYPPKVLKGGKVTLDRFDPCPENILKKAIYISSPPMSGKTVLLRSMLNEIRDVPNVLYILLAPTNTIGSAILSNALWLDPSAEIESTIACIIDCQKRRYGRYESVQNFMTFIDMCNSLPIEIKKILEKVIDIHNQKKSLNYEKSIQRDCSELISRWIRNSSAEKKKKLWKTYGDFIQEPYLVLMIDDLTSFLKSAKSLNGLTTNYRHIGISLIILCHGFENLTKSVRPNASYYISKNSNNLLWLIHHGVGSNNVTRVWLEDHSSHILNNSDYHLFLVFLQGQKGTSVEIEFMSAKQHKHKHLIHVDPLLEKKIYNDSSVAKVENIFELSDRFILR